MRVKAAEALGRLGRADKAAEVLLSLARDRAVDDRVRVKASEALGKLERPDEAAELLLALARDRAVDERVREQAADTLGWLEQATPEVLAGLRALAEGPGTPESVRRAAREALERLEG